MLAFFFITALLSPCKATSDVSETGQPFQVGLHIKKPLGFFFRVGDDITFRKYDRVFSDGLFNSLANFAVYTFIFQIIRASAVSVSGRRFESALARESFGVLSALIFPSLLNSLYSYFTGQRVGSEQIKIGDSGIAGRFYIELIYGQSSPHIRITPFPGGMSAQSLYHAKVSDDLPIPSAATWQYLHSAAISSNIERIDLSWDQQEVNRTIHVQLVYHDRQTLSVNLPITDSENLPESIESLLHNKMQGQITQAATSLLNQVIIERVAAIIEGSESTNRSIPAFELMNTLDFDDQGYINSMSLCGKKDDIGCGYLQLVWEPLPTPHVRPVLLGSPPVVDGLSSALVSQVASWNKAELAVQLIEQEALSRLINAFRPERHSHDSDYPPVAPAGHFSDAEPHMTPSTQSVVPSFTTPKNLLAELASSRVLSRPLKNNPLFRCLSLGSYTFHVIDPHQPGAVTSTESASSTALFSYGAGVSRRSQVGGKGMFLEQIREAGLPVPPFRCINTLVTGSIENHPVDISEFRRLVSDFEFSKDSPLSLNALKKYIDDLPVPEKDKRHRWLSALSTFIASEDFYQQIEDIPAATKIRSLNRELISELLSSSTSSGPLIVRSSGIAEDSYGNAQAGKYESIIHSDHEDIVRTCLRTMASAYKPEASPSALPEAMALVIQQCIECETGGVVMSHQSLTDNTVVTEYVPGQPRGAVSGLSGVIPHRYRSQQSQEVVTHQFVEGSIGSAFVLKEVDGVFREEQQEVTRLPLGPGGQTIPKKTLDKLFQFILQLENRLLSPVDVEFAISTTGRLYILQVRPITRLPGGVSFSMEYPSHSFFEGVLASEGCASGTACIISDGKKPDRLPENAILFAEHGYDWMLDEKLLSKAAGFVFRRGGTNDHVAISLRQAEKPCMIAHDQNQEPEEMVTLVCGSFSGTARAFLLQGDYNDELRSTMSSSVSHAYPMDGTGQQPSPPLNFNQVDHGFQWLNQQNARLLDYFAHERLINRCLSSGKSVQLSMHPERKEIIVQLQREINNLLEDSDLLLRGYKQYLELGKTEDTVLSQKKIELAELEKRFASIKESINKQLLSITRPITEGHELPLEGGNYRAWIEQCKELLASLQALNIPSQIDQVSSVHDLVFWVHQAFVNSLSSLALSSGQGKRSQKGSMDWIDFEPSKESNLLSQECEKALKIYRYIDSSVVNMSGAFIINSKLGCHFCTVEMLEEAEHGKGRTLRLKFSDNLTGMNVQGGIKRMFILWQLLKAASIDRGANGFNADLNEAIPEILMEWTHIESKKAMQKAFTKIILSLPILRDLDYALNEKRSQPSGVQLRWDLPYLKKQIKTSFHTENNQFGFHQFLFNLVNSYANEILLTHLNRYSSFLDKKYQDFIHYATELETQNSEAIRSTLSTAGLEIKNKILLSLLLNDPQKAASLVKPLGWLDNKDWVLRFLPLSPEIFRVVSEELRNDDDVIFLALSLDPMNMEYIPESLISSELAMVAVSKYGNTLKYVPESLISSALAMVAVLQAGSLLTYVPKSLISSELAKVAISQDGMALRYVPESLVDCDLAKAAVSQDGMALQYVPESLISSELAKAAISQDGMALRYVPESLVDCDLAKAAISQNGMALRYVPESLISSELAKAAVSQNLAARPYIPTWLLTDIYRLTFGELARQQTSEAP